MAEEEKQTDESKTDESVNLESVMARLQSLEAEREIWKKNEQGLQRTITELKEKEKEKEREKETAEERVERLMRDLENGKKKLENYEVMLSKRDIMANLGIPKEFENRIFGNTPEEIRRDAEDFKNTYSGMIEKMADAEVSTRLSGNGKPPVSSSPGEKHKNLETFEDGKNASKEDFDRYLSNVKLGA